MMPLAAATLLAWVFLAVAHGRFWQRGPALPPGVPRGLPAVVVVVPARDEAALIGRGLASLLAQDYRGKFRVILVDDDSSDATAALALALPGAERLTVLAGSPRPAGWAGKLWALQQGVAASDEAVLLLTDADIEHAPNHLSTMLTGLEAQEADMVSEMVRLHCASLAERALVPAFVYLFAMLYPFARVNDPASRVAAAAGGSVLIRRAALTRIGGVAAYREALIDDVALAARVKPGGRIWLGHTALAHSIRPYPAFRDIWAMITRSAYVQLRHSPFLLVLTTLGMAFLFIAPPVAALAGQPLGYVAWALTAALFWPSLARYGMSPLWAPLLPLIALFYMAATIGSALHHHLGRGVVWKNRAYADRRS